MDAIHLNGNVWTKCIYAKVRWWVAWLGMKTVRIFFDRIRNRICLEGLRSVRIRIQILKSHIYDVDIQSYPIQHSWHYPYLNPNRDRNMKTNIISVISVRIRSIFIPSCIALWVNFPKYLRSSNSEFEAKSYSHFSVERFVTGLCDLRVWSESPVNVSFTCRSDRTLRESGQWWPDASDH